MAPAVLNGPSGLRARGGNVYQKSTGRLATM
jgi:hypothetical protein